MAAPPGSSAGTPSLRTELNCNMVRCSHYPQSPHFLDACDELGLMVWEEPPGWQYVGDAAFPESSCRTCTTWWSATAAGRRSSSGAPGSTRRANADALYQQTRQVADQLDGSRPTSGAMASYSPAGWAQDVFGYDDYHAATATPR